MGRSCGVVVFGEHPCQRPNHSGVNAEDESHIFFKNGVFQDEPVRETAPFIYPFFLKKSPLLFPLFVNLPRYQHNGQNRKSKSGAVSVGHACIIRQHNGQVKQGGNSCPRCIDGNAVLNLQ